MEALGGVAAGYRSYEELARSWEELVRRGARSTRIGESAEGQPLVALEIGERGARRVSFAMAGVHALEWIGVEVLGRVLDRLASSPPRGLRVIAVPVVNVDGYRAAEADVRAGRRRFRRANARGVDLNRNWPTHFRARPLVAALFPFAYGPGPRALSEPETRAIAALLDAEVAAGATIARAVSLHSAGRTILLPYGGRWSPAETRPTLMAAARALGMRLTERYKIRQTSRWLPGAFAYGMEIDHLYARYGATALLVECSMGGARLDDLATLVEPFRWYNPAEPARVVQGLAPGIESFLRGEGPG